MSQQTEGDAVTFVSDTELAPKSNVVVASLFVLVCVCDDEAHRHLKLQ